MSHEELANATWGALRQAGAPRLAALPWGATEAHNYHLPYGTDNILTAHVTSVAAAIARKAGTSLLALPGVPFGVNTGQLDNPMTINMNPSTQALVLADVADSLARHAVEKLVIVNGHGGNDFKQMIRELQPRVPNLFLCSVNWPRVVPWKDYFDDLGDHAGEMETSLMLHCAPELVRPLNEAGPGKSKGLSLDGFREGWAWAPREWKLATTDTGVGNPAKATAEKGRRFFEAVTGKLADFFVTLAKTSTPDLYR